MREISFRRLQSERVMAALPGWRESMRPHPWRLFAASLLLALIGAGPAWAPPAPPSPATFERMQECHDHQLPASPALTARPIAGPAAPAVLRHEWSVRLDAPGVRLGRALALVWTWETLYPPHSDPALIIPTDAGLWILIPLGADGRIETGRAPMAFPIRGLPGPPGHASPDGGLLEVPSTSQLVSYELGVCGVASPPAGMVSYGPARRLVQIGVDRLELDVLAQPRTLTFETADGFRVTKYTAGIENLPAPAAGEPATRPDGVLRTDFPLARGCDQFDLLPAGPSAARVRTSCSPHFAADEAAGRASQSKRHRFPPAVTGEADVGLIGAPVRFLAGALPEFDRNRREVPFGDLSDPGAPTWLYMLSQRAEGGPIEIHGFHPYRAHFPRGPGGVDPPPPPPG